MQMQEQISINVVWVGWLVGNVEESTWETTGFILASRSKNDEWMLQVGSGQVRSHFSSKERGGSCQGEQHPANVINPNGQGRADAPTDNFGLYGPDGKHWGKREKPPQRSLQRQINIWEGRSDTQFERLQEPEYGRTN